MKKLWKYIAGFFTIVIGGLLAFLSGKGAGRKDEKFKGLKSESKKVSKRIKDREKETVAVKQSLKRRGVNPMYCYNPELDALNQLQKDVNELKSRPVYKPVNPLIEKMKQGKVY